MHTKKIDIYLYTVYTWPLTTDTKKDTKTCRVKPIHQRPLSPNRRLLNKSSRKECTSDMTARYCSNTRTVFPNKRKGPGCPSELSINQARLRRDLYKKEQCGKDRQHHNGCECPSQTRSTQHASFFQPESNVQYDGYIVQSKRPLHIKSMCHSACRNQQMGQKKVHYSFLTLAQMVSTFCKWQSLNINSQATNVW